MVLDRAHDPNQRSESGGRSARFNTSNRQKRLPTNSPEGWPTPPDRMDRDSSRDVVTNRLGHHLIAI